MAELKLISAASPALVYMGRIDFTDHAQPEFYWAGSNVRMRFRGTCISAQIYNRTFYNDMSLGYILDGKEGRVDFPKEEGEYTLSIAEGLEDAEHTVILFKRQDATHWFRFKGFLTDGRELEAPALPERRIECFGDSVSAGAVVEAVDCTGQNDPEGHEGRFDNAWYSYAAITARNLGAQLHDTAQGGIAIFDRTGYYHSPDCIGMETAFDKLCYFPEDRGYTAWDFTRYVPDVVIFAVGQNDQHKEGGPDPDIYDPEYRARWKGRYEEIIRTLRGHYPKAEFVLLLTVLGHDPEWDRVLDEIVGELGDGHITHLKFTRSGKATPGHPRKPEQYEMAEELTAYLSGMGDGIWGR